MIAEPVRLPLSREEIQEAFRSLQPGETLALEEPLTVEEFYDLVEEDDAVELIDGVIYMPSPVTDNHEALFAWLFTVLNQYVEQRKLGAVRGSRAAVRIGPRTAREPDLMFIRAEHRERIRRLEVDGPADFIIEIVDSNRSRREAVVKQAQYEARGVPELWVIDLPKAELRHFLLEEGRFRRVAVDPKGEVAAKQVPGFRLKAAWLFQGPDFPSTLEVVTELLREPPSS
jgi:Uma2 family endonuclease